MHPSAASAVQRWILAAVLLVSAVAVWPRAVEPFMLLKATLIVLGALGLAACWALRTVSRRRTALPVAPATLAAAAFLLALLVTTVTSTAPWTSVVGTPGRYSGLSSYLAYLVVFLAVLRLADLRLVQLLSRTAVVSLTVVSAYGLLQWAGLDPLGFPDIGLGSTYSFFGNTNFSGAWAGAAAAPAAMLALSPQEPRIWRVWAAALVPVALLYALATGTSQGPVVFLVAVGWASAVTCLAEGSVLRRAAAGRRRELLAGAAVAAVAVAAVLGRFTPMLRAQLDQALVERPEFWQAALRIFADRPLLGTGLDTYGHHFLAYRPARHALANGFGTADAPHSVPLAMLSHGGLLLGLTHLAFVLLVGIALVRGVRTATGEKRLALAGFGGVWWGYQAQSLISFDVPPLALLHWISAGVVLAVAAPPRWREVPLPGAVPQGGRRRPVPTRAPGSSRVLAVMVVVLTAAAGWFALYPLRADLLAATDADITSPDEALAAVQRFDRAAGMNPAAPNYPYLAAETYAAGKVHDRALREGQRAARRAPGSVQYALFVAREAQLLRDQGTAVEWIREAVRRDPRHPAVLVQAGGYLTSIGQVEEGQEYLERALRLQPDNAEAKKLLTASGAR